MGAYGADFDILNVSYFLKGVVGFCGHVQYGRAGRFCGESFSAEIYSVHISVSPAVGYDAPMVVVESEAACDKINRFAFKIIGVEHVPIGFIRVANVYERDVAKFCVSKPFVELVKLRVLVERIAELVKFARGYFFGAFVQKFH